MKNRPLLIFTVLTLFPATPVLHAEKTAPKPPAADVFDIHGTKKLTAKKRDAFQEAKEATRKQRNAQTPRLTILTEFIEIEQADLTRWISDPDNPTDGPALRRHVQELLRDGKASLRDMSLIASQSGQRSQARSIDFHVYPSEYDPPKTGKNGGDTLVPVSLGARECRDVGFTTEVDPVLGPEGRFLDLNLSPEIVELAGKTTFGKEESVVEPPTFHTMKITTNITVPTGQYGFLGTTEPDATADPDRENPIVLVFVRADVHHPPKAPAKG